MTDSTAAHLMDGGSLAAQILEQVAQRAAMFDVRFGRRPCLAAVLVGEDPASVTYVKMKQNRSRKAGIDSRIVRLPETTVYLLPRRAEPSAPGVGTRGSGNDEAGSLPGRAWDPFRVCTSSLSTQRAPWHTSRDDPALSAQTWSGWSKPWWV